MASGTPDLLRGLSEAQSEQLLALAERVRLASGQRLFDLGEEARSLHLIERGRIVLTLPMQVQGQNQDVFVEERLPGQALGWSALIPPHRYTLKATAQLDTDLLALPREALLAHFAAQPVVGSLVTRNVAALMGQRLQVFQTMWLREMQRAIGLRHP
ncbi:MAG: Crp/Fnr family transcriptional regulator [Vicinamibacteria bacterium]